MKRSAAVLMFVLMACSGSAPDGGGAGTGQTGSGSGSGSGSESSSGGATTGTPPPPGTTAPPADTTQPPTVPPSAPTIFTEFATNDVPWVLQLGVPNANVSFGVADAAASDGKVVQLLWPGLNNGGSADNSKPYPFATQIATNNTAVGFGTYRARVKLARCAATEEVVNGIFVYSHPKDTDTNGNGIEDNTEIDIEILCGEPQFINMTIWTDYQDASDTKPAATSRTGRVIDTKTGEVTEFAAPKKSGVFVKMDPNLIIPDFPKDQYYEMGFEWQANSVRFFIVIDNKEVTLWDFKDASIPSLIPQNKGAMMFNLWYSKSHWNKTPSPASYAADNAIMSVDWFKYWK